MTIYRTGLLPDDGRHKRLAFKDLRGSLGATPLGGADLTAYACPVYDQNWVGSCVMNGTQTAATTTLAAQGTPLGFDPSVLFGYQLALRLDRSQDYPARRASDMPALQDRGTQILTGVRVMSRYGVRPMGPLVTVGGEFRYSDCAPWNATAGGSLDLADVEQASTKLLVGAYEIDWPNRKRDMQLSLDARHSLSIGGFVDTRTYMPYVATSEPIGAQDLYDPDGGGHCTELLGYKTDATGHTLWKIKGSWGKAWGKDGYGWVTDDFVDQLWSVFCMSVRIL